MLYFLFSSTVLLNIRLFLAMAGAERKAVIKNADMAEDMQQDAVECATQVSSSDEQLIFPLLFFPVNCLIVSRYFICGHHLIEYIRVILL